MPNGQPPQGPPGQQPQGPPGQQPPPESPAQFLTPEELAMAPEGTGFEAVLTEQMEGFDPALLFDEEARPEETSGVRDGQTIPGTQPEGNPFDLSDDQKTQLCQDTIDMLDLYDSALYNRWEREEEIEAAYALASDPIHGGVTADAEHLISEFLMSQVDQAGARIEENLLGARPLIKVDPIVKDGEVDEMTFVQKFARSTENFLNAFCLHDMKLEKKLPIISHRTVKTGTCILHPKWISRRKTARYFGNNGEVETEQTSSGSIEVDLPPNRHVICWPPDKVDWQECSYVGHRFFLTEAEFKTYARRELDLDDETILQILTRSPEEDYRGQARTQSQTGIRPADELDRKVGSIKLTQLYFYITLPDQEEPHSGYMILHEDTRQILLIDKNRYWKEVIPYFPVRYKVADESAWGTGIGDEVIYIQAQDTALRNLQMDNLMSGAFNIYQVAAGTMADVMLDRPLPGQMVPVDKPGEDIVSTPMGGKAAGIDETVTQNRFFGREATGLAPVLGGQGDPTMKSGAGTGSTLALIEQAGKKFGAVDRRMRADLSDFFTFVLELVTQYAQDGLYYKWASDEDAHRIELFKYEPLRGILDDNLRVFASAPNAATSKEGRHQSLMVFWQFINQHNQLMMELAAQVFAKENPTGYKRWLEQTLRFMDELVHDIAHSQEVPGLASLMPHLPEVTPIDTQMNALMQQLQEAQQKIEQMTMEQQQAQMMQQQQQQGAGGLGGGPMPPGGPPNGMPPGGGM